jgi:hypothetical protein
MTLLDKIKNFFELPKIEITPEREDELIDNIAKIVSQFGLELPAQLVTSFLYPVSSIVADTTFLPIVPFLEGMGIRGWEWAAFLEKKDNILRLQDRLEEMEQEKYRKKEQEKYRKKKGKFF